MPMPRCEAGCATSPSIAYGSTQRTVGRRAASAREFNPYETPYQPFLPASAYAMAANRHMHEYGTTREQMAAVAVAAREWALLNPVAWEKKPLPSPTSSMPGPISDPFTVRDICLVTDGGGAIVLVSADRARSMRHTPVYVLGSGQSITHASITSMPILTHTGAIESGRAGLPGGGGEAGRHSSRGAVRRVHHQHHPVPRGPRVSAPKARAARSSRAAGSRRMARSPSTPTAAACRTAIPACTACSC